MDITLIESAPWNTRGEISPESVKELAESIKSQGLINPITVWFDGKAARWYCIAGNRRLAALRAVGKNELLEPYDYTRFDGTAEEAKLVTVTENLQREDVSPIEEAALVVRLMDAGMTLAEVGAKTGKGAAWARRRRMLGNLDDAWKKRAAHYKTVQLETIAAYPAKVQQDAAKRTRDGESFGYVKSALARCNHDLAVAKFDTVGCAKCAKRTGACCDLFGVADGELGCCMDGVCFDRKREEWIGAEIARLTADADEVVRVNGERGLPKGEEASAKKTRKHPCAYVAVTWDERIVVAWGESKKAREAAEARAEAERQRKNEEAAAKRERSASVTDDMEKLGDDEEGFRKLFLHLLRDTPASPEYASLLGLAADAVVKFYNEWHSYAEWADIIKRAPMFARIAGITKDDAAWFVEQYGRDEDGED